MVCGRIHVSVMIELAQIMNDTFSGPLRSERLILRRFQPSDGDALCAYRSLPAVARYQYWDSFGPEDAARLIADLATAEFNRPGTWVQLALIQAATGCLIGDCGLHCHAEDTRQMEFGITLSPGCQGFHYADEAIECLLNFGFGSLQSHRVSATVDVRNRPAIALCRRLGFREEGHFVENIWFKGGWNSDYVFAMLKEEWLGRPGLNPTGSTG